MICFKGCQLCQRKWQGGNFLQEGGIVTILWSSFSWAISPFSTRNAIYGLCRHTYVICSFFPCLCIYLLASPARQLLSLKQAVNFNGFYSAPSIPMRPNFIFCFWGKKLFHYFHRLQRRKKNREKISRILWFFFFFFT